MGASGKWEFPFALLFPPFSALYSCIRQKKEEKEEQKETNLFLFLLMEKRQKKVVFASPVRSSFLVSSALDQDRDRSS